MQPNPNAYSPFNDPEIRKQQRVTANASYKAFNAVAGRLLGELRKLYPEDVVIRFLTKELDTIVAQKDKIRVPAINFFKEIRKDAVDSTGQKCNYIDLLMSHDDSAFRDPVPIAMLQSIGIAEKAKNMGEDTKNVLWEYMDRLVRLSAQAVFSSAEPTDEMNELGRAVISAAMSGKKGVEDIASDPAVGQAAERFLKTVK